MKKYENLDKNISITAEEISIGRMVEFGRNISVKVKGKFEIGDFSRLGNNTEILGNNVIIGKHLFNSSGLRIGGGEGSILTLILRLGTDVQYIIIL